MYANRRVVVSLVHSFVKKQHHQRERKIPLGMKNSAIILLCAIALASARSTGVYPNGCPVNWDEEQLLPHPNCNKFYQCWDGKLVPLTCPSKLYFSIKENRCEWAEVVDCVDREVPDDNNDDKDDDGPIGGGNSDPSLAPEICAADDSDDILVAHENCKDFYICAHGRPVALTCPDNLFFNPQTDRCDWPKNVDCGDRVIPEVDSAETEENDDSVSSGSKSSESESSESESSGSESSGSEDNTEEDEDDDVVVGGGNDDPSLAPEICAAEGSDDVLVANENCNQFYICAHGKPVVQTCPNNLLFNPQTDRCDWPKNVDCGDRVIPEVDSAETEENDDSVSSGSKSSESESSESESSGSESSESESSGSEDNTEEDEDDDVVVGGGNDDPSLAPEICAAEGSDDVLVANENCNQFYICAHGKPVVQTCPNNLLFNPQTDRCDWPKNVDCGDRVIPEVDSAETEENDDSVSSGSESSESESSESESSESESSESESSGSEDNTEEDEDDDVVVGGGNDDPSLAPEICAAEDSDDVLVANENCNQFYICAHGKPVVQTCPNNLLFNPQTDRCDWPKNVDCGDRVIPEVNSAETEENDDSEESSESESSESEGDTEEDDDDVVVGGGNDDPSLAPEICAAEGSNDVLVANENCNQFYICAHGKPVVQTCPNNLLFNPQTDRCDWPKNVDCGDRVIPEVDSAETEENDDSDSSGSESSESESSESESSGSESYGSESSESESSGSEDNTEEDEDDDVVVGGGNDDPSLAPEICAAEGSDDVLVANENCNQFYICAHGKPVVQTCPNNLLFNPQTDRCDWPKNVDCGDRVIPEVNSAETEENDDSEASSESESSESEDDTEEDDDDVVVGGGNDDPSLAPEICAAEGSNDILVANENCNQFYICTNGKPVVQTCPNNLLFNPQTDRCDWPKNVDCGDRVNSEVDSDESEDNDDSEASNENGSSGSENDTEEDEDDDVVVGGGNDDPSLAPEICAAEGSDDVLVANENCNQFYICTNGKPVVQTCPNNLLFNPQTDRCDWPKNVDCGDRVIPEVESSETEEKDDSEASNESESSESEDKTEEESNESESSGNEDDTEEDEDDDVVVGGGNDDPSLAPEICAAEDSEDVLVAHENCNEFYICSSGKPVTQSCPANLLFNPQTDRCDWPKNVECGDRVIPDGDDNNDGEDDESEENSDDSDSGDDDDEDSEDDENDSESSSNESEGNDDGSGDDEVVGGGNSDPSKAPEICAAEGSDNVLVANEDCSKFYICANGKPLAQKCPANLLFNPQIDRCDWPNNVVCGDRVIPDGETEEGNSDDQCVEPAGGAGNDDPRLASQICAQESSQGILVAHEDCNQFYVCDNGLSIAVKCPASLLFNPYSDRCDWPSCVDCNRRVSLNKHLLARRAIRSAQ